MDQNKKSSSFMKCIIFVIVSQFIWVLCNGQTDLEEFFQNPDEQVELKLHSVEYNKKIDSSLKLAVNVNKIALFFMPFKKIPSTFYLLPKLRILKFEFNSVVFEDSLAKLNQLVQLGIFSKKLKYFPSQLENFDSLKILAIGGLNPNLIDKNNTLCKLKSLEYLDLRLKKWPCNCQNVLKKIKFLGLGISKNKDFDLSSLENADSLIVLGGNFILDSLAVEQLLKIKRLRAISRNKLPSNLSKLKQLEAICISDLKTNQKTYIKQQLPNTFLVDPNDSDMFEQFYHYPNRKAKELPFFQRKAKQIHY